MFQFEKELYGGNLEYKLHLKNITATKFENYSTQLKYRVLEGKGVATYILGIMDSGVIVGLDKDSVELTINKFEAICHNVDCRITTLLRCGFKSKIFLIIKIKANFDLNDIPFYFN